MFIASVIWTLGLVIIGGTLFVVFPYGAIIENDYLFWAVVGGGIVVSFVCSSSELAFGLACGEGLDSEVYKKNEKKLQFAKRISINPTVSNTCKDRAEKLAIRLEKFVEISQVYTELHNPRLVVTNNIANIVVAVVSGFAAFDPPRIQNVGTNCSKLWDFLEDELPSLRCTEVFGTYSLPLPVNSNIFQFAVALTLILILGEIIPKQLATTYPRRMTEILFPIYTLFAFLSMGTGRAFGGLGRLMEAILKQTQAVLGRRRGLS